jgi:hypothetical protein
VSTVPLRTLLLLAAAASAIGCEVFQRPAEGGGSALATAPSSLKREVDDVPALGTGGTDTTTGVCDTPPCSPEPEPQPSPVRGQFLVTSADQSTIRGRYETKTTSSGLPKNGIVGNTACCLTDTVVQGTGRFADAKTAIFAIEFGAGSTATITLKWSIAQAGIPDGYRSYGDSATIPYSSQTISDSSCPSGYRSKIEMSGRMENIGRFTATLDHCVSVIQ